MQLVLEYTFTDYSITILGMTKPERSAKGQYCPNHSAGVTALEPFPVELLALVAATFSRKGAKAQRQHQRQRWLCSSYWMARLRGCGSRCRGLAVPVILRDLDAHG